MSSISVDDVKKLAALSALSLSTEQITSMQNDLGEILSYIEQLQDVNVEGVEPTYDVHGLENVMRDDVVIDYGLTRNDMLKNAPEHDGASIVVPRVIE